MAINDSNSVIHVNSFNLKVSLKKVYDLYMDLLNYSFSNLREALYKLLKEYDFTELVHLGFSAAIASPQDKGDCLDFIIDYYNDLYNNSNTKLDDINIDDYKRLSKLVESISLYIIEILDKHNYYSDQLDPFVYGVCTVDNINEYTFMVNINEYK